MQSPYWYMAVNRAQLTITASETTNYNTAWKRRFVAY